jgi:ribonucleoside-diphosphate reductase subunit M2
MSDSPAKKLSFEPANKENVPDTIGVIGSDPKKPIVEAAKPAAAATPKVAPSIKDLELGEPLLQENPHRFVLFPLKYHEVRSNPLTRHALSCASRCKKLTCWVHTDLANV